MPLNLNNSTDPDTGLPIPWDLVLKLALNPSRNGLNMSMVPQEASAALKATVSLVAVHPGDAAATPLADAETLVSEIVLVAGKVTGADNAVDILYGDASGQTIKLFIGERTQPIKAPPGKFIDLRDVYIKTSGNGDGVQALITT